MSLAEYIAATAPEKAQIAQGRGWRLHQGTDNWKADTDKSNARAKVALAASDAGLPRPIWGTHQAARHA